MLVLLAPSVKFIEFSICLYQINTSWQQVSLRCLRFNLPNSPHCAHKTMLSNLEIQTQVFRRHELCPKLQLEPMLWKNWSSRHVSVAQVHREELLVDLFLRSILVLADTVAVESTGTLWVLLEYRLFSQLAPDILPALLHPQVPCRLPKAMSMLLKK